MVYNPPWVDGILGIWGSYYHIPNQQKSYSPPYVDRIWLRLYYNKIPIYPVFYLIKGDYICGSVEKHPGLSRVGEVDAHSTNYV